MQMTQLIAVDIAGRNQMALTNCDRIPQYSQGWHCCECIGMKLGDKVADELSDEASEKH
jgi:hypothetical protein